MAQREGRGCLSAFPLLARDTVSARPCHYDFSFTYGVTAQTKGASYEPDGPVLAPPADGALISNTTWEARYLHGATEHHFDFLTRRFLGMRCGKRAFMETGVDQRFYHSCIYLQTHQPHGMQWRIHPHQTIVSRPAIFPLALLGRSGTPAKHRTRPLARPTRDPSGALGSDRGTCEITSRGVRWQCLPARSEP